MQITDLSIIIPTYFEAENISPLVESICSNLKTAGLKYEIIIVDDNSGDGIDKVTEGLKKNYPVSLIIRENERGLATAVIAGFKKAKGKVLLCMDADMSHPPEKISDMALSVLNGRADFVIGSRFIEGGSAKHFNFFRNLNAGISRLMARPLVKVSDPMAGFFALDRALISDFDILNPLGFKIGLELLVKMNPRKIAEIPIEFKERLHGESKLSLKEQINYIRHLVKLYEYRYKTVMQLAKFCLVGASGMVLDLAVVYVVKDIANVPFRAARACGFICAVTSNFLLNRKYTFRAQKNDSIVNQYLKFFAVSVIAFCINWLLSVYLYEHVEFFNVHFLLASFIGIVCGMGVNFFCNKYIVFKISHKEKK